MLILRKREDKESYLYTATEVKIRKPNVERKLLTLHLFK